MRAKSENAQAPYNRILLIDKPVGISSFDCIRRLRKALGVRKMGHAGTLDPLASGLMLIGTGEATKKLHTLSGLSKTYRAEVLLGTRTDTGDREGVVIAQGDASRISAQAITEVLSEMTGNLTLPVPRYSAVKVDGKPLYKYARAGESVTVPEKQMRIDDVRLIESRDTDEGRIVTIDIDVGSGTYIRSIAEELGRRLGVPAMLASLRRSRIGDYDIADAHPLEWYETSAKE